MTTKHYTCAICHATNSAVRLHCQGCGTIPAEYSYTGKPIRERQDTITSFDPIETISSTISVVVAHGAQRLDTFRTCKSNMRTVPMDYYAEGK